MGAYVLALAKGLSYAQPVPLWLESVGACSRGRRVWQGRHECVVVGEQQFGLLFGPVFSAPVPI